tara:strand:- start:11105 stop:13564 length:2460 start_codon:yes stop_codon:yes gene_type:complete
MMMRIQKTFSLLLILIALPVVAAEYAVHPPAVQLNGKYAQTQLVLTQLIDGKVDPTSEDATQKAAYTSSNEEVVTVDATGLVQARADGTADIQISLGPWQTSITVTVAGVADTTKVDFDYSVRPILSKAGCNMGACHASQHGKGGFILSVFGFDPRIDYKGIVKDELERRIDFIEPTNSLFLLKPTMKTPHGGGRRLTEGSVMYDTLVDWLKGGAPAPVSEPNEVVSIEVFPKRRVATVGVTQQLRVVAKYADDTLRDVTQLCRYDALDEGMLSVSESGLIETNGLGQAGVMVRFEGKAEICMVTTPYSEQPDLQEWKNNNFIDEFAISKFQELGIAPSPICDDATFVRRAYLDAIGSLPTPEEVEAFVSREDPAKREKLIDQLLGLTGDPALDIYNDRYAAYWTLKWSDLIRNSTDNLGEQGMWALHNWIRESFRVNKGIDKFVKEIITAKGSLYMNGPANYYQINSNPTALTESTSQLFMGIRLECAKCHHHPFESYSQADYYGMAAFFSRVGTKNSEEFGLFGRERVVVVQPSGESKHPRTGKNMVPTVLHGEEMEHPLDRRIPLANWLASEENPWFAKSIVNRYMSYLLGRGLVEPVDDLRSTNPATNEEMFAALADYLESNEYNVKQLVKVIMNSRVYQLSSQPTELNKSAGKFYAFYKVKRIAAEPLLDAINTATDTTTKFQNLPAGTRAIELPDTNYPNYFLKTFGKPRRTSVCECERAPDENLAQALHTLNGDTINAKIDDQNGRLGKLLAAEKSDDEIINALFVATWSRSPTEEELVVCKGIVGEAAERKEGLGDVLWALINAKEFIYVR